MKYRPVRAIVGALFLLTLLIGALTLAITTVTSWIF
jgi:hypothetical protein